MEPLLSNLVKVLYLFISLDPGECDTIVYRPLPASRGANDLSLSFENQWAIIHKSGLTQTDSQSIIHLSLPDSGL